MGLCGGDQPDPAKGYASGMSADLETLPARRVIEAAAQLGQKVTVNIPGKGMQTFDFTGMGAADYASQYGDQMSQQMLELQRQMGPQFVEQRLKELEAADPEGAAMRSRLWDTIKSGVEGGPTARPANDEMARLIQERLARGGTLDQTTSDQISQRVLGQQVANGNWLGNAAGAQEAGVLGQASEMQRTAAQQDALNFLTGGLDPQDVAYREQQQGLTNLGAFINGETPTAQFSQVSGAAGGTVPFQTGGALPGVNPNAGWQGVNNQMNGFNANQNNRQVNPWIAGLAGGASGANLWTSWNGGAKAPQMTGQQPMNYNIGTSGGFSGE